MSDVFPAQIRAFIAVKLSPELLEAVLQLQERLNSRLKTHAVRWTRDDQLHLTLRFLGNVASARLGDLEAALRRACGETPPLALALENLGCFPTVQRPAVIWVGVTGDIGPLAALAERIENETAPFGDHSEKRAFKAHLTIGRLREASGKELARIGQSIQTAQVAPLGRWTARAVELIRSELSPKGAVHTTLTTVELICMQAPEN